MVKTPLTKERFAIRLGQIGYAFRVEGSQELLTAYWSRLSRFDPQLFEKVCDYILDNETRFPNIADFRRVAREQWHHNIDDSVYQRG